MIFTTRDRSESARFLPPKMGTPVGPGEELDGVDDGVDEAESALAEVLAEETLMEEILGEEKLEEWTSETLGSGSGSGEPWIVMMENAMRTAGSRCIVSRLVDLFRAE